MKTAQPLEALEYLLSSGGTEMKRPMGSKPSAILGVILLLSLGSFAALSQAPRGPRSGLVEDWSMRHVVFARSGSITTMMAAQRDPRAFLSWRRAALIAARLPNELAAQGDSAPQTEFFSFRGFHGRKLPNRGAHIDWSISLGAQSTAPAM